MFAKFSANFQVKKSVLEHARFDFAIDVTLKLINSCYYYINNFDMFEFVKRYFK
jgi:hypothetical protein